ncbi:MAG: hypothetical protein R3B83_03930 [Nitrospirales bacterium]|nr:hypothetical protein [Nitrospirales bacterium]
MMGWVTFSILQSRSDFCTFQPIQAEPPASDYVFGMSTALTGPASDLENMKTGVLAGFDRANKQGGIPGSSSGSLSWTDGYEPSYLHPIFEN